MGAALGLWAAQQGKRVLLVYPEGSEPYRGMFTQPIGFAPTRVAPGVDATLAESEMAMREYCRQILPSKRLVDLLFHPRVAKGFLTGIPGLREWAVLGKAWAYTASSDFLLRPEQKSYDLVILDAPASGDGAKMLDVPRVIAESTSGRMAQDAGRCYAMLQDRSRSAVVLVSLAEELIVEETRENVNAIAGKLGLPLGPLFVNQVAKPYFRQDEVEVLTQASAQSARAAAAVQDVLLLAQRRAARDLLAQECRAKLANWGIPLVELPKISAETPPAQALRELQLALADAG